MSTPPAAGPGSTGDDPLDRLAQKLLGDMELESEPPRGLDWIRSTLRSGGAESDGLIGTLFQSKYRILRRIGKGGFGAVYEAVDERGARNRVALKIQLPGFSRTQAQRETFREEAIRVTRLQHPNIVDWKSFDETPDGGSYFVMELLEGLELSEALSREGPFDVERALPLLLQIMGALRAAHFVGRGQSILHLDLKPKNILLLPADDRQPERIKVIDFGIGQFLGSEHTRSPATADTNAPPVPATRPLPKGTLTAVAGSTSEQVAERASHYPFEISKAYSAEYASPEHCVHIEFSSGAQVEPQPLDGRSDLYSFGIIAYELLTGRLPYATPVHRHAWLQLHKEAPIDAWGEHETRVPAALRQFIERCLEKDPQQRFLNSQQALAKLERIARPSPVKRLVLSALALILFGIALAQFLMEPGGLWLMREDGQAVDRHHHSTESPPWVVQLQQKSDSSPLAEKSELRLVTDQDPDQVQWTVTSSAVAGEFEIAPSAHFIANGGLRRTFPHARVESLDGLWSTGFFELIWLGPSSARHEVHIADQVVPATGSALAIDPEGLRFEVQFPDLTPADLDAEDWSLSHGEQRMGFEWGTLRKAQDSLWLVLPALSPEPSALLLRGRDRAGRAYRYELPIEVQQQPLAPSVQLRTLISTARYPWTPEQPRSFFVGEAVQLELSSNRPSFYSCAALGLTAKSLQPARKDTANGLQAWLAQQRPGSNLQLRIEFWDEVLHDPATTGHRHRRVLALPLNMLDKPEVHWTLLGSPTRSEFSSTTSEPILIRGPGLARLQTSQFLARDRFEIQLSIAGAAPATLDFDPLQSSASIDWILPQTGGHLRDGECTVEVATYLLLDQERITVSAAHVQPFQVLVDSTPPQVTATSVRESTVQGLTEEWRLDFRSPRDPGSEVALVWQLLRAGELILQQGMVRAEVDAQGELDWSLFPLRELELTNSTLDGEYTLEVQAFDEAGNTSDLGAFVVELARHGPTLSVQAPSLEVSSRVTPWQAIGGQLEAVRVKALDPNGVASMDCFAYRLESAGDLYRATPLATARTQRNGKWSWTLDAPPSWSEAQDVMLRFEATDSLGQIQIMGHGPLGLPRVGENYVPRLHSMWLVPGNPERKYFFKGRSSVLEENRCFERAGLRPIWVTPGRGIPTDFESAWALPLEAGAIEPYYLGEREVSTGDVLAFLEDKDAGYMNRSHWGPGQIPAEVRRRELIALYRTRLEERPATDLWQQEASAYAQSKGKRLPTLLELNFAIRGGAAHYRAYSWDVHSSANRQPKDPWHRIEGLSRGAEWTASTAQLSARGGLPLLPRDGRKFLADQHRNRKVDEPYWISGTPLGVTPRRENDLRSDFAAVDVGDPHHWSDARVGFRLAWGAADALAHNRAVELKDQETESAR